MSFNNRQCNFIDRTMEKAYNRTAFDYSRTSLQRVVDFAYYVMAHSKVVSYADTLHMSRMENGSYAEYVFYYKNKPFHIKVYAYDSETFDSDEKRYNSRKMYELHYS